METFWLGKENYYEVCPSKNKTQAANEQNGVGQQRIAVLRHRRLEPFPNPIGSLNQGDGDQPQNKRLWAGNVLGGINDDLPIDRDAFPKNDECPDCLHSQQQGKKPAPFCVNPGDRIRAHGMRSFLSTKLRQASLGLQAARKAGMPLIA